LPDDINSIEAVGKAALDAYWKGFLENLAILTAAKESEQFFTMIPNAKAF
jgi:hypothetical protein